MGDLVELLAARRSPPVVHRDDPVGAAALGWSHLVVGVVVVAVKVHDHDHLHDNGEVRL